MSSEDEARDVNETDDVDVGSRTDRTASILEVLVVVMAVGAAAAAWLSRGWAHDPGGWVVALLALPVFAALVLRWNGPTDGDPGQARERVGPLCAAGLAAVGAVVVAAGLDRAYPSERDHTALPQPAERVLDRDLPPVAYFAGLSCWVVLAVACLALAVVGRNPASPRPWRRLARLMPVGVVVSLALVVGVASAGVAAHAWADARAEADSLVHRVHGEAERLPDEADSAVGAPQREAWRQGHLPYEHRPGHRQERFTQPVPGWDAVLAATSMRPHRMGVAAFSKQDGTELWRYERDNTSGAWSFGVFAVDPDAGRIMLISGDAAIVLRLEDGAQVGARALPVLRGCERASDRPEPGIRVGSTMPLFCGDHVAAVEVATGRVTGSLGPQELSECSGRFASTRSPTGPTVVVGEPREGGPCNRLRAYVHDLAGERFERVPDVEPPPPDDDEDVAVLVEYVVAGNDGFLVDLAWQTSDGRWPRELVAVASDGTVRWRTGIPTGSEGVVGHTDEAVLVDDHGRWRLLSWDDGAELAQAPLTAVESAHLGPGLEDDQAEQAVDDLAVYTIGPDGELLVRSLDDLSLQTLEDFAPSFELDHIHADAGRLYLVGGNRMIAYQP